MSDNCSSTPPLAWIVGMTEPQHSSGSSRQSSFCQIFDVSGTDGVESSVPAHFLEPKTKVISITFWEAQLKDRTTDTET